MHVAKCISERDLISEKKNLSKPSWQIYSPHSFDRED